MPPGHTCPDRVHASVGWNRRERWAWLHCCSAETGRVAVVQSGGNGDVEQLMDVWQGRTRARDRSWRCRGGRSATVDAIRPATLAP